MFLEQLLNARGMLFWQGKAVQKPFLHLSWGMEKVHAFRDVAFLQRLV
jgi:hypothetical protein